ncbi:hypothetical protein DFQ01_11772 [Paenibacillus cellulosilyticus]|uniref:Uncharacterized protein n=1 Tax=Paenibacillus cellulosilyticus TaxID=375489 RepID=A0A2V2YZ19_9BACL|nr:hypothetical protein [Paenibacillus cellulosilyticus]PWV98562.1 hypothetical protein DFQ01_11772 [Paenibacillus cellulosilyticus]QKS44166.1 hypothetical protein HUB94_06760 [Paenibacillus cellulosilyticus]
MDLYHSWFYQKLLNTKGFMWFVVYLVFALNALAPVTVWLTMNWKVIKERYQMKKNKSDKPVKSS